MVFTLLALLLSIAVPRYFQTVETARENVRQQNMATLRDALDKFRADQGRYPSELAELVNKQYLRRVPLDPVSGLSTWTPLNHPAGLEVGVYDVAPPVSTSAVSDDLLVPGALASSPSDPASSSAIQQTALPANKVGRPDDIQAIGQNPVPQK